MIRIEYASISKENFKELYNSIGRCIHSIYGNLRPAAKTLVQSFLHPPAYCFYSFMWCTYIYIVYNFIKIKAL